MSGNFVWRDAGRTVVFRRDAVEGAPGLLREHGFSGYALLSTPRALEGAPEVRAAAESVHEVEEGQVPELAAGLLEEVRAERLLALGGGRVIDTAKALASVIGASVAAIPTTLSGSEMTGIHRLPVGAEDRVGGMVRPEMVIADPEAMTSQPEPALRASAMNSLAHGADSLYTPFANPVSRMTALRGAELLAASLDQARAERDRAALAEGSILCAYAIDSALFGVHHVVCQTLVRVCGTPHAETNAALLPGTMALLAPRAPEEMADLAQALGTETGKLAERIRELGGEPAGLGELGGDRDELEHALESMLVRPELAFTPGPPEHDELQALVEAAW